MESFDFWACVLLGVQGVCGVVWWGCLAEGRRTRVERLADAWANQLYNMPASKLTPMEADLVARMVRRDLGL